MGKVSQKLHIDNMAIPSKEDFMLRVKSIHRFIVENKILFEYNKLHHGQARAIERLGKRCDYSLSSLDLMLGMRDIVQCMAMIWKGMYDKKSTYDITIMFSYPIICKIVNNSHLLKKYQKYKKELNDSYISNYRWK